MQAPALFLAVIICAAPLSAQNFAPARPRLKAPADTNDWQSYFDFAASQLPSRPSVAEAGFYWAARLGPERGEPLVGRWVAYWLQHMSEWDDYWEGKRVPPEAARMDTLRRHARWRNPLMPPTLEVLVYDRLPGRWREDALTRGWLAYAAGKFDQAAELWERAIKSNPRRNAWLRYSRAGLLAQTQRWSDAIAELDTLATELQRRDSTLPSSSIYLSREIVYHALGMLHLVRNDGAAARNALGQALTENLGYAPAHATLGEAALAVRKPADAVTELAQAVELAPHDVWYRHRLGVALLAARQADSALVVLEEVSRREPLYADAYFDLGRAKEMKGDAAGAGTAYEVYLARAAARDAERIEWVRGRLAGLPR